jgi:hypothetical protein
MVSSKVSSMVSRTQMAKQNSFETNQRSDFMNSGRFKKGHIAWNTAMPKREFLSHYSKNPSVNFRIISEPVPTLPQKSILQKILNALFG